MNEVSAIIPAFNAGHCLANCLDSVLRQTLPPTQVVVIDDGSTDNTGDVARSYEDRIILIEQKNEGQGAARNKGLEVARGDYVAFLDADDYWKEDFLERCVSFLQDCPDVVAVSTGLVIKLADGSEKIWPKCVFGSERIVEPSVLKDFFAFWAEQDHVRTGSNVIRKEVIDNAGGQRADLRVSQDLEYWAYIATFGKWGFIPKPLWVGTSRSAGVKTGWSHKYRTRRRLCPTVEAWQSRVLPRLKEYEIAPFEIVRGRVAAGYAHNKILGGDPKGAREIVKNYGASMPRNQLTSLLRLGARLGDGGWWAVCCLVRCREVVKG